jgi:CHASE3 domain sensor protein
MKNSIVRLVLVLLALAAAGGAGYYVFALEQRAAALRDAERAFTEDVLRLQATLADVRAAQAGYLATGQDTAVWIEKSAQLRQQAEAQLKRIAAAGPGPDVESDVATVGEALASIGRFDKRVSDVLRDEQPLTASSLIFSEGAQVIAAATTTLSHLRGTRASKTGAALAQSRQVEAYALGGAAGVVLVVLLLLLPAPGAKRLEEEAGYAAMSSEPPLFAPAPAMPASDAPGPGLGADLDLAFQRRSARTAEPVDAGPTPWSESRRLRDAVLEPAAERAEGEGAADPGPATPAPAAPAAVPVGVDLAAAARLCTDLARVRDTSELQGLLARAATLLDASGIVVWMSGTSADVLWPAFSHGYSPHALSKMQALPREGSTPVSVAFRSGLMEVVPAGDRTSGAIVAPILTSTGCVGVMAVEIRHGAETSDAEQALAGILAAQLATLVAGDAT